MRQEQTNFLGGGTAPPDDRRSEGVQWVHLHPPAGQLPNSQKNNGIVYIETNPLKKDIGYALGTGYKMRVWTVCMYSSSSQQKQGCKT